MLLLALMACQDYRLSKQEDLPPVLDSGDTAPPGDSAPPGDTAPPTDSVDSASPGTDETGWTEPGDTALPEEDPPAPEPIYLNSSTELYSFDPGTISVARIGAFTALGEPVEQMQDIAIDLSGRMYGINSEALWRINPLTAEVTHIADLDQEARLDSLTFVSDGRLIAAGNGGDVSDVWLVDESTGALFSLSFTTEYASAGDIVGLPDGLLYWSVWDAGLLVVDPNTGSNRYLGSTSYDGIFGLGYAYGELWAFTASGEALVLDTADGSPIRVHSVGDSWWGATTNPVLW